MSNVLLGPHPYYVDQWGFPHKFLIILIHYTSYFKLKSVFYLFCYYHFLSWCRIQMHYIGSELNPDL